VGRTALYWDRRADSAENDQRHRENIPTTLRRIERLEADRRRIERNVAGSPEGSPYRERMAPRLVQLDDEIQHWQARVAAAEAAGVKVWRQADFAAGDHIQCGGSRWHLVIRANKKSLSVENPTNPELRPVTPPYDKVTGHRRAAAEAS
jgi:hypothetical protein